MNIIPPCTSHIAESLNTMQTLAPQPPRQLHIPRHNRNPLRMECHQIDVLEQAREVRLRSFLESFQRAGLETTVNLSYVSTSTCHYQYPKNGRRREKGR